MVAVNKAFTSDGLEAAICQQSFYQFVRRFWTEVVPEEPVWNWHIEYLCAELQVVAERIFKGEPKEYDLIINVPPGSTKSTIVSIMYPAWCWTRMKSMRVIGASYTDMLAMDLARKGRTVVTCEKYKRLFKLKLKPDQATKGYYETMEGGDRHAVGSLGMITGFHGHIIIVDDPLDPEAGHSEAELKKTNRWMNETLFSRKVNKRVSVVILIMQRIHQDDPTGMMLEKAKTSETKKVKHICLPGDLEYPVKPRRLRVFYTPDPTGGPALLDPVRIDRKVLIEAKHDLGQYGYAGQIGQQPMPPGGGMFKTDRIQFDVIPKLADLVMIVRYWDKAGTADGGAYTAGTKIAKDRQGRFWLLDVVRGQWDSAERERIIKATAISDGKHVIIGVEQEPGSGGKESAQATVRRLAGWVVAKDKVTGDKVTRADPYSVQVNESNVFVRKDAVWWQDYRNEMQFFPFGKYRDQIDSSSGAFAILTGRVTVGALGR